LEVELSKITYSVEIPTPLVEHTANLRENIEILVKLHFADWAMKSLVDQIKVVKPRGQGKKGGEPPPIVPVKKPVPGPAANLGV